MYLIRSTENQERYQKMMLEYKILQEKGTQQPPPRQGELPGDILVDRALRNVYMIAEDGSHRRIKNPETTAKVIEQINMLLERARASNNN